MSILIDHTRVLSVGSLLFIVHVHQCADVDADKCHPVLFGRDSGKTRVNRIRDISGVSGARLKGDTLILALSGKRYDRTIESELVAILKTR